MTDANMMLGCNPRKWGVTAPLLFAKYLTPELPPPPTKVYWEYKIPEAAWGMFGNDTIGDCTCASIAHMIMMVTAHTGKLFIPEKKEIIKMYSEVSGYDPMTGRNDNGSDLPTVLNYWRDRGISGHKILQWGDISVNDVNAQKQAIHIFGATDDAVQLPDSAMRQIHDEEPWDIEHKYRIIGGHSIPRFGYGSQGCTCVTWGKLQQGSWDWWIRFLMECCAVVTEDWIKADGLTPSGFNKDALIKDLKILGSY